MTFGDRRALMTQRGYPQISRMTQMDGIQLAVVAPQPRPPRADAALRTINVGLIGLGQVGQAVARLVPEATRLKESGLRLRVTGALVRDVNRARPLSQAGAAHQ